jgi:drug/metabolite transporter (DMT)-like permease
MTPWFIDAPMSPLPALLALHLAVALFGIAGLFGKWLTLPPYAIVLGRTAIAAAVLALVVAIQRGSFRTEPGLAHNGVMLAVHWVTFFEAIRVSSVAIGLLGYATFPLFVLGLERLLLDRRFSRGEMLIALLVVAGLVVLMPSVSLQDRAVQGLAWGVVSGFMFALLTVRSRRFSATYTPAAIAFWQNLFAAVVLLPFAWAGRDALPAFTARDVTLLVVLGVFCTALAHTLFIASLKRVSAHTASVVAVLEPVYGIALAAWLLHEIPTLRTLVGAAMIMGAALLASRRSA